MSALTHKTIVLITGANTGLGLATIQSLLSTKSAAEYILLMGSRSLSKAQAAIESLGSISSKHQVHPVRIDIDDDGIVETAYKEVEHNYGRLDVLINNAGISLDPAVLTGEKTLREAYNQTFNTNVTSTHLITHRFIPLLLNSPSPRLIFISSAVGSLSSQQAKTYPCDQPFPSGWPKPAIETNTTYRVSKAGMNMMILEWKRMLGNDGVKVFALNPGYLATGLNGTVNSKEEMKGSGAQDVGFGGEFVRKVVEGERDEDEGRLIEEGRVVDW